MPRLFVNYRRLYDTPATSINGGVDAGDIHGILVRSYQPGNLPPETCLYLLAPGRYVTEHSDGETRLMQNVQLLVNVTPLCLNSASLFLGLDQH